MATGEATTASVLFENTYEDGTTSTLQIDNLQVDALAEFGDVSIPAIKQFNANLPTSDFASRMVSKTGAKWKRISGVKLIVSTRKYLF